MPKAPETRQYRSTDADLKQAADQCILSATRDIAAFNTRGVTGGTLTAFQTIITSFDNLPTDDELTGTLTTTTEAKNAAAENMRSQIRSIRGIASDTYNGKGRYRSFGFDGMEVMSDNDLYRLGSRVVRVGSTLQAELEPAGLSTALLSSLNTLTKSFDNVIDAREAAIETRDLNTQNRIVAGNTVYAELVRLCSIGKYLFQDTDEAKYNDYIITDSPPPAPATPAA